jgi:hypothetical protein
MELGTQLIGLIFKKLLKLDGMRACGLVLGAWSLQLAACCLQLVACSFFPVAVSRGPRFMDLGY